MRVKLFQNNRVVFNSTDVDLVLVEDSNGNPVSVAVKLADEFFLVETIDNNQEFNQLLQRLNIDKLVVRQDVPLKKPETLTRVV